MSFSTEYAVYLDCAASAPEKDKAASLAGDGGFLVKPAHILNKALAASSGGIAATEVTVSLADTVS